MLSFFAALVVTLFVGDAASTFLYHVPEHVWGTLHLRIHHDRRRSFWDHAVLSKDPEVLLDGFLGALPYIIISIVCSHFGALAMAGALSGLLLGQIHVWWRHTTEIGWKTPLVVRRITSILGIVLPEDHLVHHLDPEAGFGDLFICYDRPARAAIAWMRAHWTRGTARNNASDPRIRTAIVLGLIHVAALAAFLPGCFTWSALAVAGILYYMTGALGICLGYHRLIAHRSYRVPKIVSYFLATCGTLALQGDPIKWVATHRAHHAFSDTDKDPHNARRGFLWSHIGWIVGRNEARLSESEMRRYANDLMQDPYYRALRSLAPWLTVALAIGLYYAGGLPWLVWGIFVRLVATYHVTWVINSMGHNIGYQSFDANDLSTNNWLIGILAWGEGWHNNHHAFPSSARHGLRWYEIDVTWQTIRMLAFLRIVKQVHVVSLRSRLRRAQVSNANLCRR